MHGPLIMESEHSGQAAIALALSTSKRASSSVLHICLKSRVTHRDLLPGNRIHPSVQLLRPARAESPAEQLLPSRTVSTLRAWISSSPSAPASAARQPSSLRAGHQRRSNARSGVI